MNDAELDRQLKAWAARRHAGADMRELEERISARLAVGDTVPVRRRRWAHGLSFLAGVAATVVAILSVQLMYTPRAERQFDKLLEEEGRLSAQRSASMAKIFSETERLFGPALQWVAEMPKSAEIGLSDTPSDAAPMVVRVTMVCKNAEGEWERLWGMEVVARSGGALELKEPDGAQRFLLSLRKIGEHQALVESCLTLDNGVSLNAQSREVLRFGEAKSVQRILADGREYHILQTVESVSQGG